MTTVTHTPIEERKLIQKPFITDLDGTSRHAAGRLLGILA